jgi:hypothetical protein
MTWRLLDHRKNRRYNYTYGSTEVLSYFQKYKKVRKYFRKYLYFRTFVVVLSKVISYESTRTYYKVVTFEGIVVTFEGTLVLSYYFRKYLPSYIESIYNVFSKVLSYVVLSYNLRTKILFFRYNVLLYSV